MYSLVIKKVKLVDGLGNPWRWADLGIKGERIAAIGRINGEHAERVIQGEGRVCAPGFIDMHSHADLLFLHPRRQELLEGRIRQGITTEIVGNCGISLAPVREEDKPALQASVGWMDPGSVAWSWNSTGEYLAAVEELGPPVNLGTLTGHGAVRCLAKGFAGGLAEPPELLQMQRALAESLEQGSFGLSCGLIYAPGMFADTAELVELGKVVARYDALFTSHIRGSSETLLEAEQELIEVGRRAGCRVHRSHNEAVGKEHWEKIHTTLAMQEEARAQGVDIAFDMFPYTAAMTMMVAIYPPWSLEGGWQRFLERVRDPRTRERIRQDIENLSPIWPTWREGSWPHNLVGAVGWENIYLGYVPSPENKQYQGLNLVELGRRLGRSPFDAVTDLMVEEKGALSQLIFGVSGDRQNEEPLKTILVHRLGGFATDAVDIGRGQPHPAAYGTYPKILGRYVREQGLLGLEDAVRRMTSFPASRLGLRQRGVLAEGYYADMVIFDPQTIQDQATYQEPRRFPRGLDYVIVNGRILVEGELLHSVQPGRVLRRQ